MPTVKRHTVTTCNVDLCCGNDRRSVPLQTAIRICRKRKGFSIRAPYTLRDETPIMVIMSVPGLATDWFYADFRYLKQKLADFGAGRYPWCAACGELIFVYHYNSLFLMRRLMTVTLATLRWSVTPAPAAAGC